MTKRRTQGLPEALRQLKGHAFGRWDASVCLGYRHRRADEQGGMQALVWAIGTRGQTNKVVVGANSTGVQTNKHEQNGKEVLAVRVPIRIARGAEPRVEEPSDKLRCSSAGLVGNGRDFRPGHLSIALFSFEVPAR
ncbi:uncharacterized protein LOC126648212 isoform X12 [Myiozetetes cayanensis]|uniref:uncharacterized protein LOC126648212 isoform X12 n=1 Tax=Myiozetetes cayanensis TaxID=478635 RepID=UPI00215FC53F|nr:uncharacterized protein LOC126648212 isoform X12 [Myiozetetes cayanensis]